MTPYVRILLFANIGVFFLQNTLGWVTGALIFIPQLILVRPWTIITYMFLHAGMMHLLFNMLGLYFFGPRLEERLGSRNFLILYLLSGITGALLSLVLGPSAAVLGASGAIFGVMLGFAWFWPDAPIHIYGIIPVPARLLVIITTVLSLWAGLGGRGGNVAHFAHLGGYAGAFLYLKYLDRKRLEFRKRATAGPPVRELPLTKRPEVDLSRVHEVNRDEVNRILDKISAHGMSALTPQERLFLSNFAQPDDRPPPVS
ncbi:MAG: rhomboid family intramembrane serine protease [Gemmatimonadaceae bacterium]|nr:rhomboid family intramembrane serine protease [Gemmatimonadaceae bacterium]